MRGDEAAMALALAVSATSRRVAPPNPWVGCVLVADGVEVGRGATRAPGHEHAEVVALEMAAERARGATMYVTLEPCSHHGRTPPCAEAIIAAGVARVVVAAEDPDPQVSGRGIAALRAAGVAVETGVMREAVEESLAPYRWHRTTGRPFVVAKVAATLDGAVAMSDGTSRWITSAAAREDGHRLRADSQAVLVGAGTVRADDPTLTARLPEGTYEPLRVVLGRAPEAARVRPCREYSGDLGGLLDELGRGGVLQLLVEGGPTTLGGFLAAGLVNRLIWYVAPAVAGEDARRAVSGLTTPGIEALRRGRIRSVSRIGDDVRVEVEV